MIREGVFSRSTIFSEGETRQVMWNKHESYIFKQFGQAK